MRISVTNYVGDLHRELLLEIDEATEADKQQGFALFRELTSDGKVENAEITANPVS